MENKKGFISVTKCIRLAGMTDQHGYETFYRDRGTAVHLATYLDDMGTLDESSVDPVVVPFLEAWRTFKRESSYVFRRGEFEVSDSSSMVSGHPDRECTIRGRMAVLDIKTGGVPWWARIQTAGYGVMLGCGYDRYVIQLRKEGTYKVYQFTDWNDYEVFWSAVRVSHFINQFKREEETNGSNESTGK